MAGNYQVFQWLDVDYLSFFITFLFFVMAQTFFKKISSTSLT